MSKKTHLWFLHYHPVRFHTVKISKEMKITDRQLSSSSFHGKGNAGSFGISCYIPKNISGSWRASGKEIPGGSGNTTGFCSVFISMYSLCKALGFTVTSSCTHPIHLFDIILFYTPIESSFHRRILKSEKSQKEANIILFHAGSPNLDHETCLWETLFLSDFSKILLLVL